MNLFRLALAVALPLCTFGAVAAQPADDAQMQRLALCQDSWLDWKNDNARMASLVDYFQSRLARSPKGGGAFEPTAPLRVLGQAVAEVYPQSVGMGVGFSVGLRADFSQARTAIEKQLGKPMACSQGDGMNACEIKVGPKKTVVLMAPLDGPAKTSLMGCYYFYQQ